MADNDNTPSFKPIDDIDGTDAPPTVDIKPIDGADVPPTVDIKPIDGADAPPTVDIKPTDGTDAPPKADVPKTEKPSTEKPKTEKPSVTSTDPRKYKGYVPGEPKKNFFADQLRIIKERRLLRKDLKAHGIKSREDFEIIAESLGLVLWKANPFFIWWHHAWKGLLSGLGLKSLLAAGAALLTGLFLLSTISEEKGSFTINLTGDMLRAGFVLSDVAEFEKGVSRLFSTKVKQVNNITIEDIDPDVDEIDGPHNGDNYVAYTFYIRNDGEENSSYAWYLKMKGEVLDTTQAVWLMLFEDGYQVTYTRPTADGKPEELFGFDDPIPFTELAYDKEAQYYSEVDKESNVTLYGIVTTPYVDDEIVAQGLIEDVPPGEMHKYTVVIWIEGYDPECTDDIFGGFAKFEMDFEYVEDDADRNGLFDGVFRTEYDDYANGNTSENSGNSAD